MYPLNLSIEPWHLTVFMLLFPALVIGGLASTPSYNPTRVPKADWKEMLFVFGFIVMVLGGISCGVHVIAWGFAIEWPLYVLHTVLGLLVALTIYGVYRMWWEWDTVARSLAETIERQNQRINEYSDDVQRLEAQLANVEPSDAIAWQRFYAEYYGMQPEQPTLKAIKAVEIDTTTKPRKLIRAGDKQ